MNHSNKYYSSYHLIMTCIMIAVSSIVLGASYPAEVLNITYPPASEEQKCIYLDKDGLIWIGTDNGMKSYDGYRFNTYRNGISTPNLLPSNTILSITEGFDNILWIGTQNGLAKMDKKTGKITHVNIAPNQANKTVFPLFTAKNGDVWIGYGNNIYKYSQQGKRFLAFTKKNTTVLTCEGKRHPMFNNDIQCFAEDAKGRIYAGTWEHGIFQIDEKNHVFRKYNSWSDKFSVHTLKFDQKGRLWIGAWGKGIYCFATPWNLSTPGLLKIQKETELFRIIYHIIEDPVSHTIWFCSRDGIGIIDENNIAAGVTYHKEIGGYRPYSVQSTMDLATDGKGNIWALTLNKGLIHLCTLPSIFKLQTIPNQGLTINSINAISTLDGRLFWMSMAPAGIALFDRATKKILYNYQIPYFKGIPKSPMETHVNCILQRNKDEIWLGSQGHGIIIVKNGKAQLWNRSNCSFVKSGYVNALKLSKKNIIFVGENGYLNYILPSNKVNSLKINANITAIQEDQSRNIWLSTEDCGLIKISGDLEKPQSLKYTYYNIARGNLGINDIGYCLEDKKHRIWAISKSGGLFRYDPKKEKFTNISQQIPEVSDRILTIMADKQGTLWFTTDISLVHLSIDNNDKMQYTVYTHEDGLGDILFQPKSCFQLGDTLLFGSGKNLISINTNRIKSQINIAPPYKLIVTDLLINDKRFHTLDSSLQTKISYVTPPYMKTITIPASIKKFSVEFALLSYRNVDMCQYAYRLEGYDKEWHNVNASIRQATFENLSRGTYHLQIKAADSYGRWSYLPYQIKIKVLPPWYVSWWACMIYTGILLFLIYLMTLWYKARIRTQNQLQMAVMFTNITHELLTPLAVISAAADAIKAGFPTAIPQTDIIHGNISRLTRMLRQILEVRKAQAGRLKLKVSPGDIGKFCAETCHNLLPMFTQKEITFEQDIRCSETTAWFDTDKLEKIISNLLNNAVKYNQVHGKVCFYADIDKDQLCIRVSDTGIGISANKMKHLYQRFLDGDYRQMKTLGTGIGLSLVHDLVVLHHGKIDCKSEEGKGTTFTIHIPVNKKNYTEEEMASNLQKTKHEEALHAISGNLANMNQEKDMPTISEPSTTQQEYTILLVEDNTELLTLMRNLLNTRYQIKTANNGEKARSIIEKYPLDIVITDVMMPVMNGIELTQWIKSSNDYLQLPVIMLTAKTQNEDRNDGYRVGADDYITKPFNLSDLQLRIENILNNRERIRKKFQQQAEFKVEDQHYSNPDEIFIQTVINKILENLQNCDYGREELAADLCVSSSTLYYKLRALTGQNITGFINSIRLKEACKIIKQQPSIRISELYFLVGYNTPRYFSQCFKKEFGMTVKEYIEKEL